MFRNSNKKVLALSLVILLPAVTYLIYIMYTMQVMGGYISPLGYIKSSRVEDTIEVYENILPGMKDEKGNQLKSGDTLSSTFSYIGGEYLIIQGEKVDWNDEGKLEMFTKYYSDGISEFVKDIRLLSSEGHEVRMERSKMVYPKHEISMSGYRIYDLYNIFVDDIFCKAVTVTYDFNYFYPIPELHWGHGGEIEIIGNMALALFERLVDMSDNPAELAYKHDQPSDKILITVDGDIVKKYSYTISEDGEIYTIR